MLLFSQSQDCMLFYTDLFTKEIEQKIMQIGF